MFYRKNLPMWERLLRALVGLAIAAFALSTPLAAAWLKWLLVAGGISLLCMGYIGFCPMCATVGRKPLDQG